MATFYFHLCDGIDVLLDPAHGRVWVTEDFAELP